MPNNMFPQWSPDGEKIVFTSDRDGDSNIYVMDANGQNVRQLTSSKAVKHAPVWSPDGQRIAFSAHKAGASEIWVINANGSKLICLTE